VIRSSFC